MPYALATTADRVLAGFGDGRLWQSRDRGDTWEQCALHERLERLVALVPGP